MQLLAYIQKSIGLMLATLLLISSIVIGLGFSVMEIRSALSEQRLALISQSEDLLSLTVGGATSAAWALDERLASEVVSGIFTKKGIVSAEIRASLRNGSQQVLASRNLIQSPHDALTNWVANTFFSDMARVSRSLLVSEVEQQIEVGSLIIGFSPHYSASVFIEGASTTLIISLVKALLMGLILFIIAQWIVTTPIRRAAAAIEQMKPEALSSSDYAIPIPDLHKTDEFGQLLRRTNQLLDRLKDSQVELSLLATRDPLTGLANRNLIQENLDNMLANARRSSELVAVIFIDLDRFKFINDSLGHDIGDKLLINVANSLSKQIREQDVVGRLGGDEFLVIMPTRGVNDVVIMARRIIQVLSAPLSIDDREIRTKGSLGIALFPNDGEDADTLMRCADLAMYRAKSDKSTQWHLFSEDMRLSLEAGMALESALSGAIDRKEFELYLQPKFNSEGLNLAACECLLRWQHQGEWISPRRFIEVAESTGLIYEIGDWVLSEACRVLRNWGELAVPISINVSGHQLADEKFVERVIGIVHLYDIRPGLIEFEITETMLMHDLDLSFRQLSILRNKGFSVSIDDFGTGYSSLSYLTRLPIDALKIDRSFVSGEQHSPIVLSTIVALGKALNIHIIAEGVETEQQRDTLVSQGCDMLQGYLLGRPMPVRQFEEILFQPVEPNSVLIVKEAQQ